MTRTCLKSGCGLAFGFVLLLWCFVGQAAQNLDVIPADGDDPFAGGRLVVFLELTDTAKSPATRDLYVTTDFGSLSAPTVTTDTNGIAHLVVTSQVAGAGTLSVATREGTLATLDYTFVEPTSAQLFIEPVLPELQPGKSTDFLIRAVDANLVPMANQIVTLSSLKPQVGQLSAGSVVLDNDGEGTVTITANPAIAGNDITGFRAAMGGVSPLAYLPFISVSVVNNGLLQFESPAANTQVEIDTVQEVKVSFTIGGRPVVNYPVDLSTTLGNVSDPQPKTDSNGVATFTTESAATGAATLKAEANGLVSTLDIQFVDPTSITRRYDARSAATAGPNWVNLDIEPELIGVRVAENLTLAELDIIAKRAGLTLAPSLDRFNRVLQAPSPLSQDTQWRIARDLQWRYPGKIEMAGLVATLASGTQRLLISPQIVARLEGAKFMQTLDTLLSELQFGILDAQPTTLLSRQYVFTLDPDLAGTPLERSALIAAQPGVTYAHPEISWVIDWRSSHTCLQNEPWCDTRYHMQWAHENKGIYSLEDADVDTRKAWDITKGSLTTTIAVLDSGFDVTHLDLMPNLWTKPAGTDRGIDLVDGDSSSLMNGSASPGQLSHGTSTAGIAAAKGGNQRGVTGACPDCKLLAIRFAGTSLGIASAFNEAVKNDARVISNSWGFFGIDSIVNDAITQAVVTEGAVVLFAMSNNEVDNCDPLLPDVSSHPQVIAVSGVTDKDTRSYQAWEAMGHGNCMEVLAPTQGGVQGISTTSVANPANPTWTYTENFGGTSASTPLVAGIAALMRHIAPALTPQQIKTVLQDTSDKVEPESANYHPDFGFSRGSGISTQGFGRVNAFEAVRLIAPSAKGGKSNQDIILRDHLHDWGNTEQSSDTKFTNPRTRIDIYQSPDIKIDAFPFQSVVPANDLASFTAVQTENPEPNQRARVYVRLRNRGLSPVQDVDIKIHHAIYESDIPALPADFWKSFPADSIDISVWKPIAKKTIGTLTYSGASVAGCDVRTVPPCPQAGAAPMTDQAKIASFEIPVVDWNPAVHEIAILAVAHAKSDDPAQSYVSLNPGGPDELSVMFNVTTDNNVTLWSTEEPAQCPQWLQQLLVFLGILFLGFLVYLLYLKASSQPLNSGTLKALALVFLLLVVALLLFWTTDGCC